MVGKTRATSPSVVASSPARDEGLSLVEVLVAVLIIAAVAASTATLCLEGIAAAAEQSRRQVSVTIASAEMEAVSAQAVATNSVTGVSAILTGRPTSLVATAWVDNATRPGVAQTYPASDPTATLTSTQLLPMSKGVTQVGTNYTVTTLLGTCYQPKAGGDCGLLTGQTTPPAVTPANFIQMIRAIVVVRWTAGESCAASGCTYTATSLIDPSLDLEWISRV